MSRKCKPANINHVAAYALTILVLCDFPTCLSIGRIKSATDYETAIRCESQCSLAAQTPYHTNMLYNASDGLATVTGTRSSHRVLGFFSTNSAASTYCIHRLTVDMSIRYSSARHRVLFLHGRNMRRERNQKRNVTVASKARWKVEPRNERVDRMEVRARVIVV